MKTVALKRKPQAPYYVTDQVIVDDIVTGLIANNYYVPVIDNSKPGLVFITVCLLIENYLWPIKEKIPQANLENFLRGHNPNLAFTIEHYEVTNHQ
jgi:hypothetical protein